MRRAGLNVLKLEINLLLSVTEILRSVVIAAKLTNAHV